MNTKITISYVVFFLLFVLVMCDRGGKSTSTTNVVREDKSVVVKEVKKPNGTTVKTTTKRDITKTSEASVITVIIAPNNKVGIKAITRIDNPRILDYRIEASRRIQDSSLWLDGSYEIKTKEIALGVSIEF